MVEVNDLLNLFPGYLIEIDASNKIILSIRKRNQTIGQNIPFDKVEIFLKRENIVINKDFSINDISFFLEKDNIEGSFLFPIKMEDSKDHYFKLFKYKNESKNEIYVYLECVNEQSELSNLTDPLTNVYQKFTLEQIVKKELEKKDGKEFSLIMLDIDSFKIFNDTYGHAFGDIVLRDVANVLKKHFTNGFIGRVGGDEFVICDFDLTSDNLIAKKMNEVLKDINSIGNKYEELVRDNILLSISIGIANYPFDGLKYKELLEKADKALYLGKRSGKNCFTIYKK